MSTLADLLQHRTALGEDDIGWLQRLVAEWQLVADLSFADLVLRVPTLDGTWLAVAHIRPTTGPTTYPEDVVGSELAVGTPAARLLQDGVREQHVWKHGVWDGRPGRQSQPELRDGRRIRSEVVPVRRGENVLAVLTRETDVAVTRMPSPLELTYLTTAGELLQMIGEGRFPFPALLPEPEHAPRVGDGLIRLDRTGHVVYASPNAQSAYRRLGVTANLLGAHLGQTIARLTTVPGMLDEPRGSAALAAVLRFGEPRESEVEAQGATVLLRALPLFPAGQARGALVLVRDVSELRTRERQLVGKDATIREIHHRVKNNLQTVAALLRLQARRTDVPQVRAALDESVRRVASIALVHEALSQAWDEAVAFDGIADQVLAMCAEVAVPESEVLVRRTGSFGQLSAQTATALAMVLNELVQNAVEHAYPDGGAGRVDVLAERSDGTLRMQVVDGGAGLPAGFTAGTGARLGLRIVITLVERELRGQFSITSSPADDHDVRGTTATVLVPTGAAAAQWPVDTPPGP